MKRCLLLFFITLLSSSPIFASGDPYPTGGRAMGMGNASVTLTDAWSLFNNVGGIGSNKATHFLCAYDNRFDLPGMQSMAVGLLHPVSFGNVGISINRFGDKLYSEHLVGLAYGNKISNVELGIKANYVQIQVGDLGTRHTLALEFGGVARITPQLTFGAHVYNFSRAKLASYQDERVPTLMKAGLQYKPFNKLILAVEAQKDIDFAAQVKVGVEYQIVKYFLLRTGVSSRPYINYFGFGFRPKHFQFDYAFCTHTYMGLSHHLSIGFFFNKSKKDVSTGGI